MRMLSWVLKNNTALREAMAGLIEAQDIKEFDNAALATIRNQLGHTANLASMVKMREHDLFDDPELNKMIDKTVEDIEKMIKNVKQNPPL